MGSIACLEPICQLLMSGGVSDAALTNLVVFYSEAADGTTLLPHVHVCVIMCRLPIACGTALLVQRYRHDVDVHDRRNNVAFVCYLLLLLLLA